MTYTNPNPFTPQKEDVEVRLQMQKVLVGVYEDLSYSPTRARLTKRAADPVSPQDSYYFPKNVTGAMIRPVYEKALETLGMTQEEYLKLADNPAFSFQKLRSDIDARYHEQMNKTPTGSPLVPSVRFDADLVSAYEEACHISEEQRITTIVSKHYPFNYSFFKLHVTDDIVRPIYARALNVMGITEEEFLSNPDQIYENRSYIRERMKACLPSIPDPSISTAEMKEYGFNDQNILPMRRETAEDLYEKMLPIYGLKKDSSMFLVKNLYELDCHAKDGGIFGIHSVTWKTWSEQVGSQPAMNDLNLNKPANSFTMKLE